MSAQRLRRVLSLPKGLQCGSLMLQAALVGILLSVASINVKAALLEGETIATTDFHGVTPIIDTAIGPVNKVVGPGVELTNFGFAEFLSIDFSDTTIVITALTDQPFGFFELLRFFDVNGTIPAITGVTINAATNWNGFNSSDIFFDANRIDVNLTALAGSQGQQISLTLVGGSGNGGGGNGGKVAEPPAYLLLSVGMLGMLGMSWRRRKVL